MIHNVRVQVIDPPNALHWKFPFNSPTLHRLDGINKIKQSKNKPGNKQGLRSQNKGFVYNKHDKDNIH
jgi:hypothetical protein